MHVVETVHVTGRGAEVLEVLVNVAEEYIIIT